MERKAAMEAARAAEVTITLEKRAGCETFRWSIQASSAAAVVLILVLLVLCWRVIEVRGTLGAERTKRAATGPVVQMIQLDAGASKLTEAALILAESEVEDAGPDQGNLISDCTITYFCAEVCHHVCGTVDGSGTAGRHLSGGPGRDPPWEVPSQ